MSGPVAHRPAQMSLQRPSRDGARGFGALARDRWHSACDRAGQATGAHRAGRGKPRYRSFDVASKKYAVQRLKVPPAQVNLSKEDTERVARERVRIDAALDTWTDSEPPNLRLQQPVEGVAPVRSDCGASSTTSHATRTAAWISPQIPARRFMRRPPGPSWIPANTSSTVAPCSSIMARDSSPCTAT